MERQWNAVAKTVIVGIQQLDAKDVAPVKLQRINVIANPVEPAPVVTIASVWERKPVVENAIANLEANAVVEKIANAKKIHII